MNEAEVLKQKYEESKVKAFNLYKVITEQKESLNRLEEDREVAHKALVDHLNSEYDLTLIQDPMASS